LRQNEPWFDEERLRFFVKGSRLKCSAYRIQNEATYVVLPVILVLNHIRNMLGGETGKFTFGRIKYIFRTSSNKNTRMVHSEVIVKFMTVFVARRDSACS